LRFWKSLALGLTVSVAVMTGGVQADEGMWLFTDPPLRQLKAHYGFEPGPRWLEHLQQSAVRFNNGGSGSFVSADGLVMTNHHVGLDSIHKLSRPDRNLVETGFLARTRDQELRAPDLELNVLLSVEDVTDRVDSTVQPGMEGEAAEKARRAAINQIEQESLKATGLRSDVVTLFRGGQYHLYRSKRYTDVRLVFAPEKDIAFFGGDPDNFEFPRYNLDMCFFRAYEDGRPARPEHFLRFSKDGCREGDLVLVAGHPGRTNRLDTLRHVEVTRDLFLPEQLDLLRRREVNLGVYASRSPENLRQASDALFGIQNSRKARQGALQGLQEPEIMATKAERERDLLRAVQADPRLASRFAMAWDQVDRTLEVARELHEPLTLLEGGAAFDSRLFRLARTLLRLAEESDKPNSERLREFSEANRESVLLALFSEAPIHPDLEVARLADSLSLLLERRGPKDPLVQAILAGHSPRRRALELVQGTRLADVAVRRALHQGGLSAVRESRDPMIELARLVDGPSRELRRRHDVEVEEPQRQAYGLIARASKEVGGTEVYPDATFTLRLAFGQVRGYEEAGREVPWFTPMGGTFQHAEEHDSLPPFRLPASWLEKRSRMRLDTPFNTVSTADIIGGNSGSPLVDRSGEVVGLVFDGNLASLVLGHAYTDQQARAVSLDSRAILEALRSVYEATELLGELGR